MTIQLHATSVLRFLALAAPAAAMLIAQPAPAQPMLPRSELGEAFRSEYTRRDMQTFAEVLMLTDDQQGLLETLFRDYEEALHEGSDALREQMAPFRPPPPDEETRQTRRRVAEEIRQVAREMREESDKAQTAEQRRAVTDRYRDKIRALQDQLRELSPRTADREQADEARRHREQLAEQWNARKTVLSDQFLANVRAILDEPQQQRWPILERRLRREKTIGQGELSGESVDLISIVHGLQLEQEIQSTLDQALQEYAIQLDNALKARNDYLDRTRGQLYEMLRGGDADTVPALVNTMIALHKQVRDVNDTHLEIIASAIDAAAPEQPHLAAQFRQDALLRGYPRIFRTTRLQRLFEEAKALDTLDDDTLADVITLEEAYLAELTAHNLRLLQTVKAHDPERMRQRYERMGHRPDQRIARGEENAGDEPARTPIPRIRDNPMDDAFAARRETDRQYTDRLQALLGEEHFNQLSGTRRGAGRFGDRPGRSGRDWIKEFDANGNGRLDPEEHDALREYLRTRYMNEPE